MAGARRTAVVLLALVALVASACHLEERESDRILQQSACDKLRHLSRAASEHAQGAVTGQQQLRRFADTTLELTELSDELRQSRFGEPLREHRDRVGRAFVTQNMAGAGNRDGAPPWADIVAGTEALWGEFGCDGDLDPMITVAMSPPATECRELGGGWRWTGSRDHGTTSISLHIAEDATDTEDGQTVLTVPPVGSDEFTERTEARSAEGWTAERVRGLSTYLGVEYEVAAELGFDGTAAAFAELQGDLERRLDESPRCDRHDAHPSDG
jgi:hypothetical protein